MQPRPSTGHQEPQPSPTLRGEHRVAALVPDPSPCAEALRLEAAWGLLLPPPGGRGLSVNHFSGSILCPSFPPFPPKLPRALVWVMRQTDPG